MLQNKLIAAVIIGLGMTFSSCVDYELNSQSYDGNVVIDGASDEWEGKLNFLDDEKFAMGFQNDDENLYVCLTSMDRNIVRRMLATGMIVWFENEHGETIGIRYPVREMPDAGDMRGMMRDRSDTPPDDGHLKEVLSNQFEYILVNKDNYPRGSYPINGSAGIELKLGVMKDRVAYEIKLPLHSTGDFSNFLEANSGSEIRMKIETMEMERPSRSMQPGMDGGRPGGMGGRGGGMNGGKSGNMGGGRPGGFSRESIEPIEFSVNVLLAR